MFTPLQGRNRSLLHWETLPLRVLPPCPLLCRGSGVQPGVRWERERGRRSRHRWSSRQRFSASTTVPNSMLKSSPISSSQSPTRGGGGGGGGGGAEGGRGGEGRGARGGG